MMLFSTWRVSAVLGLLGSAWLAGAHMIDVPPGKKECFFEDLHVNDKVSRVLVFYTICILTYGRVVLCVDDCDVPSRRWRSS